MPRLSSDQIEMQIEAKLTRQRILTRDNPPRFAVVLDEAALRAAVRFLKDAGVEAVAVCFLYGFVAEAHEAIAARVLAEEFPAAFSCVSHAVAPEFREFERMSTAVVL